MAEYSETIRKHFLEPRNAGTFLHPDAVGEARNEVCGDLVKIFLALCDTPLIYLGRHACERFLRIDHDARRSGAPLE